MSYGRIRGSSIREDEIQVLLNSRCCAHIPFAKKLITTSRTYLSQQKPQMQAIRDAILDYTGDYFKQIQLLLTKLAKTNLDEPATWDKWLLRYVATGTTTKSFIYRFKVVNTICSIFNDVQTPESRGIYITKGGEFLYRGSNARRSFKNSFTGKSKFNENTLKKLKECIAIQPKFTATRITSCTISEEIATTFAVGYSTKTPNRTSLVVRIKFPAGVPLLFVGFCGSTGHRKYNTNNLSIAQNCRVNKNFPEAEVLFPPGFTYVCKPETLRLEEDKTMYIPNTQDLKKTQVYVVDAECDWDGQPSISGLHTDRITTKAILERSPKALLSQRAAQQHQPQTMVTIAGSTQGKKKSQVSDMELSNGDEEESVELSAGFGGGSNQGKKSQVSDMELSNGDEEKSVELSAGFGGGSNQGKKKRVSHSIDGEFNRDLHKLDETERDNLMSEEVLLGGWKDLQITVYDSPPKMNIDVTQVGMIHLLRFQHFDIFFDFYSGNFSVLTAHGHDHLKAFIYNDWADLPDYYRTMLKRLLDDDYIPQSILDHIMH